MEIAVYVGNDAVSLELCRYIRAKTNSAPKMQIMIKKVTAKTFTPQLRALFAKHKIVGTPAMTISMQLPNGGIKYTQFQGLEAVKKEFDKCVLFCQQVNAALPRLNPFQQLLEQDIKASTIKDPSGTGVIIRPDLECDEDGPLTPGQLSSMQQRVSDIMAERKSAAVPGARFTDAPVSIGGFSDDAQYGGEGDENDFMLMQQMLGNDGITLFSPR